MGDTSPRPRFGGSKVKTGCITCKSRRVKCDEGKPSCQRCRRGGRRCDGYAAPNPNQNKSGTFVIVKYVPAVVKSPNGLPNLGLQEQRSLDYYQFRAASELAGAFAAHVWEELMMRIAHHESAIRHALIALGALHESFESSSSLQAPGSEFAMQQYGKAIQEVIKIDIASSRQAVDVAVLCCVLFTAFESLQGHYKSALTHIDSGIRILTEQGTKSENANAERYVPDKIMRKLFIRLDSQAREIGDSSFRPPARYLSREPLTSLPDTFQDVETAALMFEAFFNRLHHLLLDAEEILKVDTSVERLEELGIEHGQLVQYYQAWAKAFENAPFPPCAPSTLVLQSSSILIGILLHINPLHGEMVFDQFTPDFEQVVRISEEFINQVRKPSAGLGTLGNPTQTSSKISSPASSASPHLQFDDTNMDTHDPRSLDQPPCRPSFSLALGIITPLYVVCTRCRDPVVRRRALRILKTCGRKEGIWDSMLSARVAERIIEIEEAGAGVAIVTDASQIPEHARVRELDTFFGVGRQGRIRYCKSDTESFDGAMNVDGLIADAGSEAPVFYEEILEW